MKLSLQIPSFSWPGGTEAIGPTLGRIAGLLLVGLAGLATVIGLAPVTLHRTLFRRQVKERVVRTGNRLLIAHLVVVALLVVGVTSLVFDIALDRTAGLIALGVGAVVVVGLWFVFPRMQAAKHGDDESVVAMSHSDGEGGREPDRRASARP